MSDPMKVNGNGGRIERKQLDGGDTVLKGIWDEALRFLESTPHSQTADWGHAKLGPAEGEQGKSGLKDTYFDFADHRVAARVRIREPGTRILIEAKIPPGTKTAEKSDIRLDAPDGKVLDLLMRKRS